MTIDDLIARLETATGPDRELDARIEAAISNWPRDCTFTFFRDCGVFSIHRGTAKGVDEARHRYTESLDAAVTLYPHRPATMPTNPREACVAALRARKADNAL